MSVRTFDCVLASGRVGVSYAGASAVTAGSRETFSVAVTADFALRPGALLGLARRWPSDWGIPQSNDPAAADFVRIAAAPGRMLRWWFARQHLWHPFDHVLFVAFPEGLAAGEQIAVTFGDRTLGCPGFTVQTFIEEASPLSVRLLPGPDSSWSELAHPAVEVVGASPHRLVLTAPSRVVAGESFDLHLRVEDEWGNPSALGGIVHIGAPIGVDVTLPPCGWLRFPATLSQPGVHRLAARSDGMPSLVASSNPIEVGAVLDVQLYWGDLHAQSSIGCGSRSIDAYYAHARDFAATDFGSHQANCFLVSNAEWRETQAATAHAQEDGRFVTLLGVEWSGASAQGGDHNLYFPGSEALLHRCSHEFVSDKSDKASDLPHIEDVYARYRGTDTMVAVHVGGRTADLRWHEPTLDRLLEVHSTHATSEWFLLDALRRGYRMGVVAGSDGVDGRPGASHPGHMGVRNVRGGLTAVATPELTRGGLWSALKSRHCYATTGERIMLTLTAGSASMGDEIRVTQLPAFDLAVEGTAPIEAIDFFRGDLRVASVDLMSASTAWSDSVRIAWTGAAAPGNWQRARMQWDGELRIAGARILAAHPWAFDTPDEGLRAISDVRVAWRSLTAGDWDGLVLDLDRFDGAEVTFVTAPMTLQSRIDDLAAHPQTFVDSAPTRRVELRRLPARSPPLGWRGRFDDPAPVDGVHAYWVRVRQADGAHAWSTPIFVTLESK
ncbi:MAG: DUF3604 domain-containing protein [Betaproteobacteria bacterium]|nr:DUF3604 domain-containing protein [Betaproteobacteria bacterium]